MNNEDKKAAAQIAADAMESVKKADDQTKKAAVSQARQAALAASKLFAACQEAKENKENK